MDSGENLTGSGNETTENSRGESVMNNNTNAARPAIVLVHGGFVDGSGWEDVFQILKKDGYPVSIVQNPTTSLADDVAVTKRVIADQKSPVILVGHSYGGAVITEAGTHPNVSGLVYITAFAPDQGESVASLIKDPPAGAPVPPILPPTDGFLTLDKAKFAASFAADVSPEKAEFMANSQVPWGVAALTGAISEPAWKGKPSWYLVATDDRMIPPPAQRMMAKRANAKIAEARGSHAIYVSQPKAVAELIEKAAMSFKQ
jgi:pimeloyl-ACP methyl ester carboxylesterase